MKSLTIWVLCSFVISGGLFAYPVTAEPTPDNEPSAETVELPGQNNLSYVDKATAALALGRNGGIAFDLWCRPRCL